jgi:hypothetical protein
MAEENSEVEDSFLSGRLFLTSATVSGDDDVVVVKKLTSFSFPLSAFEGDEQASAVNCCLCCEDRATTGESVRAKLLIGRGRLAAARRRT